MKEKRKLLEKTGENFLLFLHINIRQLSLKVSLFNSLHLLTSINANIKDETSPEIKTNSMGLTLPPSRSYAKKSI